MTTALAFAQALLCTGGREAGAVGGWPEPRREAGAPPCGRCQGCRLAAARVHPDLHLIAPTPPETNPKGARAIRIDAIRGLERQAALRPVMAPRKLFVPDEAERMTGEAPQAFLKTLEGPPASLLSDAARAMEVAREAEAWTLDELLQSIDLCRQARQALARNVAPRLTLEVILSRLALRAA